MITLLKLSPYTGDVVASSPNHDARTAPAIEGIVLHATADEGDEALSLSWLCSPKSRVSCHLLISRAGRVTRLVGDRQRAWHAGLSWWRGTGDVNSITLGIELANRNDGEPYSSAQYRRVAEVVAHYCRQGLSLDDVVSHEEISLGRKTDPHGWDWARFRRMVQEQLRPADDSSLVVPPPPVAVPDAAMIPAAPVVVPRAPVQAQKHAPVLTLPKPLLHSRTLWLNFVTVLATGAMLASEGIDLARRIGIHPPDYFTKWALFAIGIVNIILRLRTTQPLTCGQPLPRATPDAPMASAEDIRVLANDARPPVRGRVAGTARRGRGMLSRAG